MIHRKSADQGVSGDQCCFLMRAIDITDGLEDSYFMLADDIKLLGDASKVIQRRQDKIYQWLL